MNLSIVNSLSTDILELVFIDSENSEILNQIKELEVSNKDNKELNILTSVYLKIQILKTIINIEKKGKSLKEIRYKTRLKNIQDMLKSLIQILSQSEDFKLLTKN